MDRLNVAQRWALMVPLAMLLSAFVLLFAPVQAHDVMSGPATHRLLRPLDPALEHTEAVQVHCGSWAIRTNRHNFVCPRAIRERRILAYAVAASSLVVAGGGSLMLRRPDRRRVLGFLGLFVAVTGMISLFRPLPYEWFDDQPRVGPLPNSYSAVRASCGSVVFRGFRDAVRPDHPCLDIFRVNGIFALAIIVAGAAIPIGGRVLLPKESPEP